MQFKRFRKAYGKYRKFAKKMRPAIVRANKTGLKAVWRTLNMVRQELNVERKYWDQLALVSINPTFSAPALMLPFDNLDQGSLPTQRIGDQIKVLWAQIKFNLDLTVAVANGSSTTQVRVMAILDTDPRGASAPSATTLRSTLLQTVATAPLSIVSPYNTTQNTNGLPGDRYKILRDFVVKLDNTTIKQKCVKINVNFGKGLRVRYYDGVSDYPTNKRLMILAWSENDVAGDVTLDGQFTRMCFVDN